MKKKILDICLLISKNSINLHPRKGNYKHFSFIIQSNQLVEWGTNRANPPLIKFGYENHQMIHSENLAYKRGKGLLDKNKKFEVVNIRLNRSKQVKISKPCSHCLEYLKKMGCSNIWFTDKIGDFKKINLNK